MKRLILALRAGHNASACIGDGRSILFAVQEERLAGEKNYWGFPRLALRACLDAAGATPADLAAIACGERFVLAAYHSRDDLLRAYRRHLTFAGRLRQRYLVRAVTHLKPSYGQGTLHRLLAEEGLGEVPLRFFDHHDAHAATAYYGLRRGPEEPYLVLTCDGGGDGCCASVRVAGGGRDEVLARTRDTHSLGALYGWVTYALGFMPWEHEYKLMGMAPYAEEAAGRRAAGLFKSYLGLDRSGLRFRRRIPEAVGTIGRRLFRDLRGRRFDQVCAGLQLFTEELLAEWAANAVRATGVGRVLAAGGVFMNVKANQRIAALPEVESFEAFPSCGDETLSLGGYYLAAAADGAGAGAKIEPLRHFYLGGGVDDADAEPAIRAAGFAYDRPADPAAAVAALLAAGHPVARCSGRMEYGARALGNRSILADPSNPDVVRVINRMIKKRDFWMPFAPIVGAERQHDFLRNPKGLRSPYMMMTFDTRDNFRELLAAVHGADLTCRAQILEREQNPEVHAILDAFAGATGRAILLNTSFNLHGFPIVRTAPDALAVFRDSGLEHLQLASFLVRKEALRG